MLSLEKDQKCMELVAADLKQMSYDALKRFALDNGMFNAWTTREIVFEGRTVPVSIMISQVGYLRKRIAVELSVIADDDASPQGSSFLYFERYKSGRFYPSVREEMRDATLFRLLPVVLFAAVAIIALVLFAFIGI